MIFMAILQGFGGSLYWDVNYSGFRYSEVLLYPTKEGCGSDSVGEYPTKEVVDLTV